MDRQINYVAQIPLDTDLLNTNRNTMVALGKLAGVLLGTGNVVNGLAVTPNSPAALSVVVAPGEFYSLQNVDNTAYGSLPLDTTDTCVKQGISLGQTVLACPSPTTAGFSINYLIEAAFQEIDGTNVVLPYYNASNPSQAYSGPGGLGAAQATVRAGKVVLQAKVGIAAATGTQVTPAVDAGYVALAVVTVANGQTTISSSSIAAVSSASVLTQSLLASIQAPVPGRLLGSTLFTANGTFTPNPLTKWIRVRMCGGGGAGGSAPVNGSSTASTGGGGAAGAFLEAVFTSGFSASLAVTVGVAGTFNTGGTGGAGGTSSLGTIATAPGGPGGAVTQVSTSTAFALIGGGGSGAASSVIGALWAILNNGQAGGVGTIYAGSPVGGFGGSNPFGTGPQTGTGTNGAVGTGYGAGGSGGSNGPSGSAVKAGGNGTVGFVEIEEFT